MKSLYLIIVLAFFSFIGNSQTKSDTGKITLTGTITDFNKKPIKGVYIYIDSIKTNARTNKDGFYKVKTKGNINIITAYSIDHGILSVSYSGEKRVSFVFSDDSQPLDEADLIELGFGNPIKKRSGKVDFEGVRGLNGFNNIYQLIEGTVAGVTVTGQSISIRGAVTSTTNQGNSTEPMFIVNGLPLLDVSSIVPSNVKSIEVIKGPEAAYYGSRGVYGVIKITLRD
ncbi:TonB-dependent receptor plug domain-containing protein [Sabulilitoribacter multivorans]|uniref:TonB-dependent receptor plug domain-containing protein n=1 Tax=Flaviramulus multivorans TaxID=1304750 RepID=A0ABS9IHR7_9FLAO|nr:TonB-dependent receptor plug domain-containing protein [Flaviramulus multivorans]MCF7559928.1 TonB-dependent receptor plug domain-containing protein [Flaviramulus multivorans]